MIPEHNQRVGDKSLLNMVHIHRYGLGMIANLYTVPSLKYGKSLKI